MRGLASPCDGAAAALFACPSLIAIATAAGALGENADFSALFGPAQIQQLCAQPCFVTILDLAKTIARSGVTPTDELCGALATLGPSADFICSSKVSESIFMRWSAAEKYEQDGRSCAPAVIGLATLSPTNISTIATPATAAALCDDCTVDIIRSLEDASTVQALSSVRKTMYVSIASAADRTGIAHCHFQSFRPQLPHAFEALF